MNNENNIETEVKLTTVSKEVLDSILSLPLITERIVAESERKKYLESHYYDTSNRRFAKAGIVFRVRKEPDGYVGTVKAEKRNSGGLSERMEYNVSLPDEQPVFDGFNEVNFLFNLKEVAAKNGGVEELFSVMVQRHQCDLVLTEDTVVEMAIDNGEIVANDKTEPVYEVEFEIKHGNNKDLLDFVALLSKEVPLFAEQKSKYFRGVELAGEKVELSKASAVKEVSGSKPFKDALREALSNQTGYVLTCVQDCLHSERKVSALFEALYELEQLLIFSKGLFDEAKCSEQIRKTGKMLEEIEQYFLVQEFYSTWQQINRKTAPVHTTMLLEKLLQEKSSFYENKVQQSLWQGSYSTCLFEILAWLEHTDWRNNVEVAGKDYVFERIDKMHDEATAFFAKGDMQKLCKTLVVICHSAKLMKKFTGKDVKYIAKTAKALFEEVENKMLEERAGKTLFSLFRASAGRLLYRDAGILLGYYFKTCKYKQQKIAKKFSEFKKAKKMLEVNEAQPEPEIIDED